MALIPFGAGVILAVNTANDRLHVLQIGLPGGANDLGAIDFS